ncbi:hypothetical protein ACSBR2_015212 [Camellia fascicularis]
MPRDTVASAMFQYRSNLRRLRSESIHTNLALQIADPYPISPSKTFLFLQHGSDFSIQEKM